MILFGTFLSVFILLTTSVFANVVNNETCNKNENTYYYNEEQNYDTEDVKHLLFQTIIDFTKAIEKSAHERTKGRAYFLRGLIYRQRNEISKMQDDWKKAKSLGDKLRDGQHHIYTREKEGPFIWYYPNGKIKTKGYYKDGREDGPFEWYYENGILKCEGNYVNGKYDGEWKWYHEDAKLKKKAIYKNGVVLKN